MKMEPILLSVDSRGVATVTLNRAELHNALDHETIDLLIATLETLAEDSSVKVVILTGQGISFSAGHDMQWIQRLAEFSPAEIEREARLSSRLLSTLDNLPKPTIARVQGSAFGMSVGLVACCDLAIGVSEALFSFSEVKLGLIPAVAAPYVIRAIGQRAARRYFVTAERFNAGKAKRLGLIHQVVENDEIDMAVEHAVRLMLLNGPQAMLQAKQLVNDIGSQPLSHESLELTIKRLVETRHGSEGREGVNAFIEKRTPNWLE
ncbi:MAG TPA: enoyl-CoA hydratase-related protein [Chromobacteriaceae bacterium]|nr:enoyl-CoA hydratase-related protein [Chromobacteriaceae bacterium]